MEGGPLSVRQVTLRAQAYEDALARFVFMAMRLDGVSAGTERRVRRLTLGALQKEYANYCLLETAHADRMRRALEVRNSLAHSFYRRRMHLLETPEGRERVIAELSDAEELLKQERDEVYWNCSLLSGEAPL